MIECNYSVFRESSPPHREFVLPPEADFDAERRRIDRRLAEVRASIFPGDAMAHLHEQTAVKLAQGLVDRLEIIYEFARDFRPSAEAKKVVLLMPTNSAVISATARSHEMNGATGMCSVNRRKMATLLLDGCIVGINSANMKPQERQFLEWKLYERCWPEEASKSPACFFMCEH